ncbi:plant PDR ABC transporter associated protein, partial [Tanacetum coccineum]
MFQNMSPDFAETHMELSLLDGDYGISERNQLALLFYMFLALLINEINNLLIGELDGVEAFLLHYGDERLCGIVATVLIPARLQYSMLCAYCLLDQAGNQALKLSALKELAIEEGLKEWLDAVCTARIPCAVVSILDRRIMVEILEIFLLMKYFQILVELGPFFPQLLDVSRLPHLFAHFEPTLLPIMHRMLTSDGQGKRKRSPEMHPKLAPIPSTRQPPPYSSRYLKSNFYQHPRHDMKSKKVGPLFSSNKCQANADKRSKSLEQWTDTMGRVSQFERMESVAATNALELGIDIGHIDVTMHLGFPGSIARYPKNQSTFARVSGYCEQNDVHSPNVTVSESLLYFAWLCLSSNVDTKTLKIFVDELMELVELHPLRNAMGGIPRVDGLTTEQQKRLTIAVELVANPSIIFMDESISGFDARAAAIVMRT